MAKRRITRTITPEEEELWRYVTRNDTPLYPEEEAMFELDQLSQPQSTQPVDDMPNIRKWKPGMHDITSDAVPPKTTLKTGHYAGVDASTAERFRKGNYPIDGTLDLHGLNRHQAHETLIRFLQKHYDKQSRCVLIVTGKGGRGGKGESVLKTHLPRWLAVETIQPMILAIDKAQPKHGGSGAYYVLLRRQRSS